MKETVHKGNVFNIQRFSLHDGPGIRSTVFLKGCPLACEWCSNPEGISKDQGLMVSDRKCHLCFKCLEVCHTGAISKAGGNRIFDREKCDLCFECVDACPYFALSRIGQEYTVSELIEEIERDRIFFLNSGGGVTFSGGEPLFQADFTAKAFSECRKKGIHTALDTSGYCSWDKMENVLRFTDLVLFDIKHIDPIIHRKRTGVDNALILENFKKTVQHVSTWVRIPLIPGFNDSDEFLQKLYAFLYPLRETNIEKMSILPYHTWGKHKYQKIGQKYAYTELKDLDHGRIEEIKHRFNFPWVKVTFGM